MWGREAGLLVLWFGLTVLAFSGAVFFAAAVNVPFHVSLGDTAFSGAPAETVPFAAFATLGFFVVAGVLIAAAGVWTLFLRQRQTVWFDPNTRVITLRRRALGGCGGTILRSVRFRHVKAIVLLTEQHAWDFETTEMCLRVRGVPIVLCNHAHEKAIRREAKLVAGLLGVCVRSRRVGRRA